MELATVKRDLYRGSRAAMLRVVLSIPIYLALTPFVLKYLKPAEFALWSFNATIIGVINLSDLGFKSGLVYHCARSLGDEDAIRKLFGAALALYGALLVVIVAGFALAGGALATALRVPAELRGEAEFVFVITAAAFGLRFFATPFQAVIEAHRGVGYSQHVMLLWLIASSVLTFVALPFHPSVYTLGWISLGTNALVLAAFYAYLRRSHPALGLRSIAFDARTMRTLMKYSAGIYLATLMITLREPLYKIFLSRTYGLEEVATFEIAFRLCTQLISAVVSPLLGVFVAAAVLAKRPEELSAMVRPVFAASLLVLPPLAAAAVAFSDVAVGWWLGAAGARVAELLPWMLSGFVVYYCTEVLYQGLLGSGRPAYASFVQTGVLAVMAAVLFFARRADAVSAVGWSMCAGLAIFSVCNVFAFRRMISRAGLFAVRDVLLLATPTVAFCLTRPLWGEGPAFAVLAFACYLVLHIVVAKALGIVRAIPLLAEGLHPSRWRLRWRDSER